jgi:uncharacterized protein (DUF1697 family)
MTGRYVAFLRGMNLGHRRITNAELCACLTSTGFAEVEAFLASGNLIFRAPSASSEEIGLQIEATLGPMTVRTQRTIDRIPAKYLGG